MIVIKPKSHQFAHSTVATSEVTLTRPNYYNIFIWFDVLCRLTGPILLIKTVSLVSTVFKNSNDFLLNHFFGYLRLVERCFQSGSATKIYEKMRERDNDVPMFVKFASE